MNNNFKIVLTVIDTGRVITITQDLRVTVSGVRSFGAQANELSLSIYNLNEEHRLVLVKDADSFLKKQSNIDCVFTLDDVLIFNGSISTSSSRKEGVDIITEITTYSGAIDIQNSYSSATILAGASIVDRVLADMPNTSKGRISLKLPKTLRPRVIEGNSFQVLVDNYPDFKVSIDNGQLYIVANDEAIYGTIPVISAQTGLISTPARTSFRITFNCIMNAQIVPNKLVEIVSTLAPHLNGRYKVFSVTYTGDNFGAGFTSVVEAVAGNYTIQ